MTLPEALAAMPTRDPATWTCILEHTRIAARRACLGWRGCLPGLLDQESLTNDVLCRLVQVAERGPIAWTEPDAYLRRIARNLLNDAARRDRVRPRQEPEEVPDEVSDTSSVDSFESRRDFEATIAVIRECVIGTVPGRRIREGLERTFDERLRLEAGTLDWEELTAVPRTDPSFDRLRNNVDVRFGRMKKAVASLVAGMVLELGDDYPAVIRLIEYL